MKKIHVSYSLVYAARGGLAGKCAKVAYTKVYYILSIPLFLRGCGLREILSKDMGGGLHERVRYVP